MGWPWWLPKMLLLPQRLVGLRGPVTKLQLWQEAAGAVAVRSDQVRHWTGSRPLVDAPRATPESPKGKFSPC